MSQYCYQCGKSAKACICGLVHSLPSNVELIILQHPSERHRPMGTAKILSLSLPNCHLFIGEDFTDHCELNALLDQSEMLHYVLYPNDRSEDITTLTSAINPSQCRVILLDGTWKKAYKIWQLSKNLHSLPCLHLPKNLKGNYRIRKAPSENSLSTVEAGYHLLQILQPDRDFSSLIDVFEHMIQFQIDQMPPGVFERNYLKGD